MTSAVAGQVVLLSARPEAHAAMVWTLRRQGVTVRVPLPSAPSALDDATCEIILVDLVHGTGLSRSAVSALNRRRGRSVVVALHEGHLGRLRDAAAGLAIEGFCRSGDWQPLVGALLGRPAGLLQSIH